MTDNNNLAAPTPNTADIDRIIAIDDPVIRNLQITQCYHELSITLAEHTGMSANWCTFATWASKQAGQTIRKEDFKRLLDKRLLSPAMTAQAANGFAAAALDAGAGSSSDLQRLALDTQHYTSAIDRASDAVGRGNKKVFEEIGREFARFYSTCLHDDVPDSQNIAHFCDQLHSGDPPDGQRYLQKAFTHYYQSLFTVDTKTRSELILTANIEIGYHEQTRLQPEIAESLDSGLISAMEFMRSLLASIFPLGSRLKLVNLYIRRLLGRPTALDQAIQALLVFTRSLLRQTITEIMMTISLPSGLQLKLGDDLKVGFPPSLEKITQPELIALIEKLDPTPDSVADSGALDWADLPDRLHFIIDLFRCYQENQELHAPPFTQAQVQALKAGRLPTGEL